ncbi:hypothetical protein H0H92_009755 [Tricholoma furcatifolium]|nr:hypothetical protein H0H92_009755 [Tricholoma furcatifolium]
MKGDNAGKWAEIQLELIQDENAGAIITWTGFVKAFMQRFGNRWNDQALLDRYKEGLSLSLLERIYDASPLPKGLKEWQEKAELLD